MVRFCLIILTGQQNREPSRFAFYIRRIDQVRDARRYFSLSPDEFRLLNPNTRTCPVFRSEADAELTKKIYHRVPVLIDESKGTAGNPWGIAFLRMFHMANDSGLFRTYLQLRDAGGRVNGMVWTLPNGEHWVPL